RFTTGLWRPLLTATLLLGTNLPSTQAQQIAVVEKQLPNGFKVLMVERHNEPRIAGGFVVKVGSSNERPGITGIAHLFEHMMFKGTPTLGTKDSKRDQEIMVAQEKLRDEMRAEEAKMRDAWRRGELEDLGNPDTKTPRWKELEKEFKKLLDAQRDILVKNEFDRVYTTGGASQMNAFTSEDMTAYFINVPANKLELWMWMESERLLHPVFREFYAERDVVFEERRMRTDSSAFGKLYESFLGVAFQAHPYGTAVIGHRSDILGYNREKIMKFYREHYVPSETIVAVVGDIDVPATKKLLTDYFGRIPKAKGPPPAVTVEPPQEGERRIEVEFPAQPVMMIGYHVPERNHPDTPALRMLSEIATSGRTSRLESHLVKQKKANSVGSWIGPGDRYPRLLLVTAEPPQGGNTTDLEKVVLDEIEKLKTETPSADEMKRVITAYRSTILRGMKSNLNLAQELADYQAVSGDWRSLFREIQEISAVKPEQVTAVAKKYLTKQNRTIGKVVPFEKEAQ
ncbi:MAG: pitrilysin family protein, partial [Planctomycetota bacterium]